MFTSVDNEIDLYVPCHMVEVKFLALGEHFRFHQLVRACTVALSCVVFFVFVFFWVFLLTELWPLASFDEGEEERFKFESPGFISGCSDVRQWEKA